ncbi:MAG: hypothetical protein K2K17_11805 [Lachnospiraceae bacterium]|nr:hypothetical protein [Lachnospiraceae bacterium]
MFIVSKGGYEVQDAYKNGDDQSPLYYTPIELEIYSDDVYLKYEYDAETKEYTIVRRYSPYYPNKFADWDHIFIGHLDEEGNLIVTHYERTNYAYSGNWQEVVLDDIEWMYIRESADTVSDK